jgi:lysophospholipase L1-like esterase
MTSSEPLPIMIVGDSVSDGGRGDLAWHHRLRKHLTAHRVAVELVGLEGTLDIDHDARWGRPYVTEKEKIEARVAEHRPAYLLVLLGINDLDRYGVEPPEFEANLREFVANARRAEPGLRIVLGRILPTAEAAEDRGFEARVAACNGRIETVAKDLDRAGARVLTARTDAEFVAAAHTRDGTRPNPAGEFRIAAAFADALADSFGLGARYARPFPDVAEINRAAEAPIG